MRSAAPFPPPASPAAARLVEDKGPGATHPTKGIGGWEKLVVAELVEQRNAAAESVEGRNAAAKMGSTTDL